MHNGSLEAQHGARAQCLDDPDPSYTTEVLLLAMDSAPRKSSRSHVLSQSCQNRHLRFELNGVHCVLTAMFLAVSTMP